MEEEQTECPLVTPYTNKKGIPTEVLEKLFLVRKWDFKRDEQGNIHNPLPFKWPSTLRKTLWDPVHNRDTGDIFELKEYQKQQVHHMVRLPYHINGDSVGLGKTACAVSSACWLKDRFPKTKIIVLTTLSTVWQWHDEFIRFSTLRPKVMADKFNGLKSHEARLAQAKDFLENDDFDVLICKYDSLKGTRKVIEGKTDEDGNPVKGRESVSREVKDFTVLFKTHKENIVLVLDEAHKFKSPGSSIRNMVFSLTRQVAKVWALTATLMKNSLDEAYAVCTAVGVAPFGWMPDFVADFCIQRQKYIGGGRKKMEIVGYKNVPKFKEGIRPFFLGRSQRQVKEILPRITTVYHPVELSPKQTKLIESIGDGSYVLPPALIKVGGELYEKERDPDNLMTKLSVNQLVVNHWGLLDSSDKEYFTSSLSPKEEALLDLLEGDLKGEKVVTYSRYKTWWRRLTKLNETGKFSDRKLLKITGDEDSKQRNINKNLFQTDDQYDWIGLTSAGLEGINLQTSGHLVILDVPWSWGDLLQLVGRIARLKSKWETCTVHIIMCKGTIDEYAIDTLRSKKGVFEAILGNSSSAGILDDKAVSDLDLGMESVGSDDEYLRLLKAHVKKSGLNNFLMDTSRKGISE